MYPVLGTTALCIFVSFPWSLEKLVFFAKDFVYIHKRSNYFFNFTYSGHLNLEPDIGEPWLICHCFGDEWCKIGRSCFSRQTIGRKRKKLLDDLVSPNTPVSLLLLGLSFCSLQFSAHSSVPVPLPLRKNSINYISIKFYMNFCRFNLLELYRFL